jgi:hypothetical protein
MTRRTETEVMMMTTGKAFMGTRLAASLHRRSVAEDAIETTATHATSSVTEMHVAELKADAEIGSVKSKNGTFKETMITMVLTTTNFTRSGTHPRRHQGIFPRLEAGPISS